MVSFNHAEALGPILFESIFGISAAAINYFCYYVVGPISGAIMATYVYRLFAD